MLEDWLTAPAGVLEDDFAGVEELCELDWIVADPGVEELEELCFAGLTGVDEEADSVQVVEDELATVGPTGVELELELD